MDAGEGEIEGLDKKKACYQPMQKVEKKHHLAFLTRQRNICLPLSSLYSVPILGVGDGGGWGRVHTVESILVVCEGINKGKWEQWRECTHLEQKKKTTLSLCKPYHLHDNSFAGNMETCVQPQ